MRLYLLRWVWTRSHIGPSHWADVGGCAFSALILHRQLQFNFSINLCVLFSLLQIWWISNTTFTASLLRYIPQAWSWTCSVLLNTPPCCFPQGVSLKQPPPHWPGQTGPWAQMWQSILGIPRAGTSYSDDRLDDILVRCPEHTKKEG